jgi:hypothetical protein
MTTAFVPEGWELCEIFWWRGYVKAEFYAVAGSQELARSPAFRWRGLDPPERDHEAARASHDTLVQRLVDEGWEPLGDAVPWYAQRFHRHASRLRLLPRDEAEEVARDTSVEE